jgi:toxin ParE1/3/4
MKVRWARAASRHLEEIGDYIARENPAAADRVVLQIMDHAETLSDHSHIGRAGRIDGTREWIVSGTPYIVVYRVSGGDVEVLAVFHGARRWPDRIG